MIININEFENCFVDIPTKLIEHPKSKQDWIDNFLHKYLSIFRAFDRKDILDIFSPETFFYDEHLNLYFYKDINYDRMFFSKDQYNFGYNDVKWYEKENFINLTVVYNITKNKIALLLTKYRSNNNDEVIKGSNYKDYIWYDIEFIKKYLNYKNLYDWEELRKTTDALIKNVTDVLDNFPFYYINDTTYRTKPETRAKYDHSVFYIPVSYKVVGGLFIELVHKTFYATDNKLDYRFYEYSTKKYWDFDDTITFKQLLDNDGDFVIGYDKEFVKECIAFYKKRCIQSKIDEKTKAIEDKINKKKTEIEKLEKQLNDNQTEVNELTSQKNAIKAKDIKINLRCVEK
jgi:hypothetical protein